MRKQGGFVINGLVMAVAVIAFLFITSSLALLSRKQANIREIERATTLDQARQSVESWYQRNVGWIDATGTGAIAPATVMTQAGVANRHNIQMAVSDSLVGGDVRFRRIAIWIPPESVADTSELIPATGVFTPHPAAQWVMVDGLAVQTRALSETRAALAHLASLLEVRFRAKAATDPNHSIDVNYFLPLDRVGCAATADEMPCLTTYTAVTALPLQAILSVDETVLRDAWGNGFEASNVVDSSSTTPPFSMALRARTPWGTVIRTTAVQPVN